MMIFSNRNLTIIRWNKKRAFTMIELVIISIMIATWLIWIVVTINYGIDFAERTKTNVVAINLAREWVEAVYNIRDSNRQRRWIKKEQCWLKLDPLSDEWNSGCENDAWIESWENYVILTKTAWSTKYNYLLEGSNSALYINDRIDNNDRRFIMCKDANEQWYNCPSSADPYTKEWWFFRSIRWIWLYNKESWSALNCSNWSDIVSCWTSTSKEFRFCSTVQYQAWWIWQVELCGILTNFLN